jgi:hypothetical protein
MTTFFIAANRFALLPRNSSTELTPASWGTLTSANTGFK